MPGIKGSETQTKSRSQHLKVYSLSIEQKISNGYEQPTEEIQESNEITAVACKPGPFKEGKKPIKHTAFLFSS